jgi:hypothetical protein
MTTTQTKNETKAGNISTIAIGSYPGALPSFVRTVAGRTVLVTHGGAKSRTEVYAVTQTGLEMFRGYADEVEVETLPLVLHSRARRAPLAA